MLVGYASLGAIGAFELPDQELNYEIKYKWGMIHKEAATATLSLRNVGDEYHAELTASTLPWADHILRVRDTLKSVMERPSCVSKVYIKHNHQGESIERDRLVYSRSGNEVTGRASRIKQKGDSRAVTTDTVLYANGPTMDMLSVFFWMRLIDFDNLKSGTTFDVTLFSAWKVQHLEATYLGETILSFNGKEWPTYEVKFNFYQGAQEVEEPMYVWLSTDEQRIPVKLVGVLELGRVEAYFTGSTPL